MQFEIVTGEKDSQDNPVRCHAVVDAKSPDNALLTFANAHRPKDRTRPYEKWEQAAQEPEFEFADARAVLIEWVEVESREPTKNEQIEFVQAFRRPDAVLPAAVTQEEPTDERCRELASREKLSFCDWVELTGVGIGEHESYEIGSDGVHYRRVPEAEIAEYPVTWQGQMVTDNETPPLLFPCLPAELLTFVDTAPGIHCFDAPAVFRVAVAERQIEPVSGAKQDALASDGLTMLKRKAVVDRLGRKYRHLESAVNRNEEWVKACRVPKEKSPAGANGWYYLELIEAECRARYGGHTTEHTHAPDLSLATQLHAIHK